MNRSPTEDAFLRTLDSKPRQLHSTQSHRDGQQSEVNRLSRVFENPYSPPKPIQPTKSPVSIPIREETIDTTPIAFNDIRAKFQEKTIMNRPPMTKPTYKPPAPVTFSKTGPSSNRSEKIIVAARTGPPALPIKPKPPTPNRHTSHDDISNRHTSHDDISNRHPSPPHPPPKFKSSPTILSRTATGNSSILSTTSSHSSQSKKAWHISQWFATPEEDNSLKQSIVRVSVPLSPQVSGPPMQKRLKVINELLETEVSFQSDMNLLKSIYYDQAMQSPLFSKSDIRTLFSNLLDIIDHEKTFVAALKGSTDNTGKIFRDHMQRMDAIYSEYCKRHQDAVNRLQELEKTECQAFFNDCKEQLQGKTMSWDLGSLMIKPVQRVLKYPLLLRELLSVTSPTHHDHDDLLAALKEMEEVADNINEIKRRKDIVEKIVGDKKKTEISVVHGFNKKITRKAQQFKQATGLAIEPTHDLLFESMHAQFEEQQEDIRQFARDIQGWVRHVKVSFEHMQQLSGSMKSLYNSWGGVRVKSLHSVDDFNRMSNYLFNIFSRELDNDVRSFVYSHIDELLRVYENPNQVIHKRSLKMIDYDRVRDMKSKGDIPDKSLQESADAYVSINAQLVEELPQFFLLTSKYFDIILKEWTTVQVKYFNIMKKETQNLIQRHLDLSSISSYEQIISHNQHQLQKLEPLINDITIINKRKSYQNSLPSSLSSQGFYSLAESDNDVTPPTSSVYSHLSVPPPDTRSSSHEFKCVVLYDFETHEEDMLNVKRGTLLRINQDEYDPNDGWWYATTVDDTQSGLIPISYCRRL